MSSKEVLALFIAELGTPLGFLVCVWTAKDL